VFIELIALKEERYRALGFYRANSRSSTNSINSINLASPMSYIHEALKKAQQEREALAGKYSGFISARREGKRVLKGRSLWWAFLLVVLVLLAFGFYSWLDSTAPKTTSAAKDPGPHVASTQKAALSAKELYHRARGLQKSGRSKEARGLYQKALTLNPKDVLALNNIGVTYIQEGNYQEALKSFEHALQLKPEYVDPCYNLACLYAIRGEVRKGLDYLRRAILLDESVREWARKDRDLQGLRAVPEFEEILRREDEGH
jgi:tetratricopeptide (TPR) repeat protein